jgi:hypothetical protein
MKNIRIFLISLVSLISLLSLVFLISCATPQIINPVCPKEGSFICAQSEKMGVQPETVYGWIYSATAIAAVSDVMSIKEICDFEQKIANWYVSFYPVSYDSIISKVVEEVGLIDDPKKAILIKNILNQYLILYSNKEFISAADDEILKKGHSKFRSDMLCN